MNFALTDEQQFLTEAADQALERLKTIEAAREALEGDALDLWPTAVEAGWTGLLVPEEHDGAGLGLAEAQLVLERCGRLLADARLLGHLPASALLPRADLASGAARAAFVDGLDTVTWDGAALTGEVRWVIDAPGADVLVVAARDAGGAPVAAWLAAPPVAAGERSPGDAPVTVARETAYDATRALGAVTFAGAPAELIEGADPVLDGRALQRALLAAEDLGATVSCLDRTREYAVDRHAFGRSIGSYQAIKHKLVEMLRRAELTRSLVAYAGLAHGSRRAEFELAANAARVQGADALDYAAAESIFIHGGVGATWEADTSLYYRRAEQSRRLQGGSDAAALTVADALEREPRGFT